MNPSSAEAISTIGRRLLRSAGSGFCGLLLVVLVAGTPVRASQPGVENPPGPLEHELPSALVEIDGRELFRVRGTTAFPAELRAQGIGARIRALAANGKFRTDDLKAVESEFGTAIDAGRERVLVVTEADARLEGVGRGGPVGSVPGARSRGHRCVSCRAHARCAHDQRAQVAGGGRGIRARSSAGHLAVAAPARGAGAALPRSRPLGGHPVVPHRARGAHLGCSARRIGHAAQRPHPGPGAHLPVRGAEPFPVDAGHGMAAAGARGEPAGGPGERLDCQHSRAVVSGGALHRYALRPQGHIPFLHRRGPTGGVARRVRAPNGRNRRTSWCGWRSSCSPWSWRIRISRAPTPTPSRASRSSSAS